MEESEFPLCCLILTIIFVVSGLISLYDYNYMDEDISMRQSTAFMWIFLPSIFLYALEAFCNSMPSYLGNMMTYEEVIEYVYKM